MLRAFVDLAVDRLLRGQIALVCLDPLDGPARLRLMFFLRAPPAWMRGRVWN
jgi:hypothetical protein